MEEPVPDGFWDQALEMLNSMAFREMESSAEISSGWASVINPFQEEITMRDISFGNYLLVSMRVDQKKIPAALLKKHCLWEEQKTRDMKGLQRLSGKMRKEIRERVKMQLLLKAMPIPSTHDVCWNIQHGQILFFSCQEKMQGTFEDLFFRTFRLKPTPVIPYSLATDLLSDPGRESSLKELAPEVLI